MNSFVKFLNKYNTGTANHENVYDEYISQESDFKININTKIDDYLLSVFGNGKPISIILTGNAGDGKTRLCRRVIEKVFNQKMEQWIQKIIEFKYDNIKLCVVKDLSELQNNEIEMILSDLQVQLRKDKPEKIYLIAANEGKLTKFIYNNHDKYKFLRKEIENRLENPSVHNNEEFQIINLNDVTTSSFVEDLMNTLTKPEYWEPCISCCNKNKCIINFNVQKLSEDSIVHRLSILYRILDMNQNHITIRDLLIHVTYLITGGLSCQDINKMKEEKLKDYVYYENCWGLNKESNFKSSVSVIKYFEQFRIGDNSVFEIDNFIISGDLEKELVEEYKMVFAEELDLEFQRFKRDRDLYIYSSYDPKFISNWLPRCRRKIYFEARQERYLSLLPFKYLQAYIDLLGNTTRKIKKDYKDNLIAALNRCFSGKYLNYQKDYIIITTNLIGSNHLSTPIIKGQINAQDVQLFIESCAQNYIDRDLKEIKLKIGDCFLKIDLFLFEFLMRIVNGGTHNVLADLCSLRVAGFRDQLINARKIITETDQLELFSLSQEGYIRKILYFEEERVEV